MSADQYEVHGLRRVRKHSRDSNLESVVVLVADDQCTVRLSVDGSVPAGLTPAQARFVAGQILASADRVAAANVPSPESAIAASPFSPSQKGGDDL